ncbi:hypothetical protein WAI453_002568 [Rhynchosporium graminicola]
MGATHSTGIKMSHDDFPPGTALGADPKFNQFSTAFFSSINSLAMYQPAPNLTLLGLLDIITLSAEVDQNDKTRYTSAHLAQYLKSASQHLFNVTDDKHWKYQYHSQFGTAGQAIIEKVVGFPKFAKLPAVIRTMIWKHALPDPRKIRITSMITYNNIWGDPNDPLIVLRSVCKESLDVVTRRYQMIPYSNLGSVTTVKPRLTPATVLSSSMSSRTSSISKARPLKTASLRGTIARKPDRYLTLQNTVQNQASTSPLYHSPPTPALFRNWFMVIRAESG